MNPVPGSDSGRPGHQWITPAWPAPAQVRACSTTRHGGHSVDAYASFNLGTHVGDSPQAVSANRAYLGRALDLPAEPCWLNQVHGQRIVSADPGAQENAWTADCEADGCVTGTRAKICVVLTADCLPILLCDRTGSRIGAVHAGWRGLAGGVVEAAVAAMECPANQLLAWLGPGIGHERFEVGAEVRTTFLDNDRRAGPAFAPSPRGRWLADLYQLARLRLSGCGVDAVYGGDRCTYDDPARFYSYRRDGVTGRMATLIWIAGPKPSET